MKFGTSLAAATIATVATADYRPKVANFAYAHQWDLINVEGFNAIFSSSYDIGVQTDVWKTNLKGRHEGNVMYNWFLRGFADWEVQFGLNIGDYWWFIFKSKAIGIDVRPVNVHVTLPDWIDQYDWNAKHTTQAPTCFGVDMEANFASVKTTMEFNFKQVGISFLDTFNGKTQAELDAGDEEPAEEEDDEEEEPVDEIKDDDFLAKLRQEEECGEDGFLVDEEGETIFDDEGNPIECEPEEPSRQSEFWQDQGVWQWDFDYKMGGNDKITNLLQYPGFNFKWPLMNWCTPPQDFTRVFWMSLLETFNEKKWGNKEYYSTS
jgi:hypothetical protein